MPAKVRWGVLGTAKIGTLKVIPAMQRGEYCTIVAIASRDHQRARQAAKELGIPGSWGSYDELLQDRDIDAVYIPLPNHMHVPWAIKAIQAGKHVLCEKPVALSSAEAAQLAAAAKEHPDRCVMEAFMYRFHPQWQKAKELADSGTIGEVMAVRSFFSYYNVDPGNIRNRVEAGGGALMDIGCYCISFSRYITGSEPVRVLGMQDHDPEMKTDRATSGILEFPGGAVGMFTCSTQMGPFQRCTIHGTQGSMVIEIPVNAPADASTRIRLQNNDGMKELVFGPVDQYTLQGDAFAGAVLERTPAPIPLDDAVNNMAVIDAMIESARTNAWVTLRGGIPRR